jgi:hypothetical protein
MTYVYSAYGLCLCADRLLPGLAAVDSVPSVDVKLRLDSKPTWLQELPVGCLRFFRPARAARSGTCRS